MNRFDTTNQKMKLKDVDQSPSSCTIYLDISWFLMALQYSTTSPAGCGHVSHEKSPQSRVIVGTE